MSSILAQRIKNKSLLSKVVPSAHDLVPLFHHGQWLGWSGFTGVGYPKMVPLAIADHVEKNNLQGQMKFNLCVGASSGAECEDVWARLDMIDRRFPHQVGKNIQDGINSGRIRFQDKHLSMFPQDLVYGFYTKDKPNGNKLDVVIVEATAITEDGAIIPGAAVGASPELIQMADKIIIELNTSLPSFEGLHDITQMDLPPFKKPVLINRVDDRIGRTSIPIDPEKVIAVVESNRPDNTGGNDPMDDKSEAIAQHIIDFLQNEVKQGRLPKNLLPLQSGIGNVSNAIIGRLAQGPFHDVSVFTEVLQDTFLDYFDQEKLRVASATSIRFSPEGFDRFYKNWDKYTPRIILRNQSISNSPEVIKRLGVIAMNTPVEFDIYGHANSTCVNGSRMLNGLGGSGDFLRNAFISIMHAPSTRPTKVDPHGISSVVTFSSHIDHTEHDLDVFVTEQGLADLRGLTPKDRAKTIIEKCAHPEYKPILKEYFELASKECLAKKMGHEPHMLRNAFKMHTNLMEKGTMKVDRWD